MQEEHSGVNLVMFEMACRDLDLLADRRLHFQPKAKLLSYTDVEVFAGPYLTHAEIDTIFKRHSQHLKRISSVSHGKGVLNEAQFAAAFAQLAVVLMKDSPWCERYKEEWRRVDALFSRLDIGNVPALRNRMKGNGGFRNGDGDLRGRDGKVPKNERKGFSYPLRLVGDPVTPPPESSRRRRGGKEEQRKGSGQAFSTGERAKRDSTGAAKRTSPGSNMGISKYTKGPGRKRR